MNDWNSYFSSLKEIEAYQRKVRKGHVADRDTYITGGTIDTDAGGSGYKEKPPRTRSKSAPPLGEEVEPESFEIKDTLHPEFWQNKTLAPEVSERLIHIVKNFMADLEPTDEIVDIRLTGSLANYNWSKYSDIDLHIVIDFAKNENGSEVLKQFYDKSRMLWNDKHRILIKGFEVEIYVEDVGQTHHSSGVYSVMSGEWVVEPERIERSIDFDTAKKKSDDYLVQIGLISQMIRQGDGQAASQSINRVKDKISQMRNAGLETPEQEFSPENIAFKILRREGALKRLRDLKHKVYDSLMSLKEE